MQETGQLRGKLVLPRKMRRNYRSLAEVSLEESCSFIVPASAPLVPTIVARVKGGK